MERELSKNEVIGILSQSHHGDLTPYIEPMVRAAKADPEFFAHLIAWNQMNGSLRDPQLAAPILSLPQFHTLKYEQGLENSLAHLAMQSPRDLYRGVRFAKAQGLKNTQRKLAKLARQYLAWREQSYGLWESAVVSHKESMENLYCYPWAGGRIKLENEVMRKALFEREPPEGSTLWVIQRLAKMEPKEALGQIITRGIPFKVALGVFGNRLDDVDLMLGVINAMSPTELVTHMKTLEKRGVKKNPVLRAALDVKLQELGQSTSKQALFKTSVAAKALGGKMGKQLNIVQERQMKATGGLKGRWVILGDKSDSMKESIEVSKFITSHIARVAEDAHLIYFNTRPDYRGNMKGLTLEQIKEQTAMVTAQGGTSPGAGLDYLRTKGIQVDGIVCATDGGERHAPGFSETYKRYCDQFSTEPVVYIFEVAGKDPNWLTQRCDAAGIVHELINLREGVDYYSLPNIIATMNCRRYGLVDQIMETPLLTLEQVFNNDTQKGREGHARRTVGQAA